MRVTIKTVVSGYWDGGAKKVFDFKIEGISQDDAGYYARIGCFAANHWYHVGAGKKKLQTDKQILKNALQKTSKAFRADIASIEWIEKE